MNRTDVKFHRGNQSQIELQADLEIRHRVEDKQPRFSMWKLFRSVIESLEAIQPQVTIYPYGDLD